MKKLIRLFVIAVCLPLLGGWSLFGSQPEEKLVITEVVSSNSLSYYDPVYGARDWFEIYNGSDEDVSLAGLYVSENPESAKLYELPDAVIPAGGYYVVLCGGNLTEGVLPFGIGKTGETLSLVSRHKELIRSLEVPALVKDVSYAMRADGTYGFAALPTPGKPNTGEISDTCPAVSALQKEEEKPVYLPLIVSSVVTNSKQYFCEGCGEFMDVVTVTNPNDAEVLYEGYMLNDKDNPVKKGALPEGVLAPGASLTVFCCGDGCSLKGSHVCVSLGLSKNGDSLYLFAPDKTLLDTVGIPALEEGAAYYRREDGSFAVTAGVVRHEETDTDGRPAFEGAYPLDRNASVRLNELLYKNKYSLTDGYGDRSDFAELYNASSAPVSLEGWFLSDSESNLMKWALPPVTIGAGQYLVVFLSGRGEKENELHASFRVGEGETLYLYNSLANTVDALTAYPVPANVSVGFENGPVMYGAPTPGYPNGHPWPVEEKNA